MSDFRRRLMMCKNSESDLPSGYTKLNYLEKDGYTQYINTGVIPQPEWTYEFDFERIGQFNYLCGSDIAYGKGAINISMDLHAGGLRTVNFGSFYISEYKPKINQKIIIAKTPNEFIIDSNVYNIEIGKVEAEYPLVIFTTNRKGEPQISNAFIQKYRLYRFSIKNTKNELIMNLLPCLDKNGKPCMFDTVSKQPFYNQGTGEFLYG